MRVEQLQIGLRILHMFRWGRSLTTSTHRIGTLGLTRYHRFQTDVTLPLGVIIVHVAETLTRLKAETSEGDLPGVRRVAAIVFAEDVEMVKVFIAPREEDLQHAMEMCEGRITVDQQPAPDERTDVAQDDACNFSRLVP